MILLAIGFIALFTVIALAPREAMQMMLAGAWLLMALTGIGSVIAAVLR